MELYQFVMLWGFNGMLATALLFKLDAMHGIRVTNFDVLFGCIIGFAFGLLATVYLLTSVGDLLYNRWSDYKRLKSTSKFSLWLGSYVKPFWGGKE